MNKYIVPIYSFADDSIWIEQVIAPNLATCQEKLMDQLSNDYNIPEASNYKDFVKKADERNLIIGIITDIEGL